MRFEDGAAIARERSAGRCEVCGQRRCQQTHHRRARGMGGRSGSGLVVNRPSNLLRVCLTCHDWIEHNPTAADALGLLHPDGPEAPAWLATVYGRGWWQLTDDGCYLARYDLPDPANTPQLV